MQNAPRDLNTNARNSGKQVNSHSSVNCVLLNARSLKSAHKKLNQSISNIACLQNLMYTENIDVAFITETWLNNTILDNEILPNTDFIIFRKDRQVSRGGGVLLAVRTSLFHSVKPVYLPTNLEVVSCEVRSTNGKFLFCACYRPPSSDSSWRIEFGDFLRKTRDNYDKVVIGGDFNLPNINWESIENTVGTEEVEFTEILNDYFLSQLSITPTRCDNVLDLVITSTPDVVTIRETLLPNDAGIFTDHAITLFDIEMAIKAPRSTRSFVHDYRRTNFNELRAAIETQNLSAVIDSSLSINENWSKWKNTFNTIISQFVPMKQLKRNRNPPWISGEILHTIHL